MSEGFGLLLHGLQNGLGLISGKDAQVHAGCAQVRTDPYLADSDQQAMGGPGLGLEHFAELFLHQSVDFLLSGRIHGIMLYE
ncbi:MAG: hypothetical protein BWY72_00268 [Bacteroidetes bacterium ADurb.Bin416]|nr:MAG: hypothetical protein BWY72_00268 [Bacteroidetes bacterium ADurb.Bin416]